MHRTLLLPLVALLVSCGGNEPVKETTPAKVETAPREVASASKNTEDTQPVLVTPTLQSIHEHGTDPGVPTVEFSIPTIDEKGSPVLWSESLLARLHHKGFTVKGRQAHFRGRDEIESLIEEARNSKTKGLRFGEVRIVAEESKTDAKIRILVRELECKDWKTRVLAPIGRVGTDEAAMTKLSEDVERAVTESLVTGFTRAFCE